MTGLTTPSQTIRQNPNAFSDPIDFELSTRLNRRLSNLLNRRLWLRLIQALDPAQFTGVCSELGGWLGEPLPNRQDTQHSLLAGKHSSLIVQSQDQAECLGSLVDPDTTSHHPMLNNDH